FLNSFRNERAERTRPAATSASAGARRRDILAALKCFSYVFASISTASALPLTVITIGRPVSRSCSKILLAFSSKSERGRISSDMCIAMILLLAVKADTTGSVSADSSHQARVAPCGRLGSQPPPRLRLRHWPRDLPACQRPQRDD